MTVATDDRWWCGLAQALDRVGDRWTLLIVRELEARPRRPRDLRENLPGIRTALLADRLLEMESDGLIVRTEGSDEVALTRGGRELEEAILALTRWGGRFVPNSAPGGFRPEWLALVLEATDPDPSLELRMDTGGRVVGVRLADGRTIADVDRAHTDDVVELLVRGDPRLLAALAAGYLSIDKAEERGLVVRGVRRGRRMLERVVA